MISDNNNEKQSDFQRRNQTNHKNGHETEKRIVTVVKITVSLAIVAMVIVTVLIVTVVIVTVVIVLVCIVTADRLLRQSKQYRDGSIKTHVGYSQITMKNMN
jgi:uncharacterized membrane protein